MKTAVIVLLVAALYVSVVESNYCRPCGIGGCPCSDEPNGGCCPGHTCNVRKRCCEVVALRDEFVYPLPYDCNYGYTEYGVPGYQTHYHVDNAYVQGSAAYGLPYVGTGFNVDPFFPRGTF